MSTKFAITFQSISKSYKLYKSRYDRVKEFFHPLRKQYHHKFNALKNITFTIEKGEVIGIIGQNGSGKSTLLKILTSVVNPTLGSYQCHGRVSALLELSAGFNIELTGIENIYFLGAIQGIPKNEMAFRIEMILDFADIGEYAYQAVSTYSSGMYVRLAFSMAINIDPDILIIDEALSVGDIRFQQKCFRKIREFKDQGKTIMICTHNLGAVRDFCTKAIWIHEGEIVEQGDPIIITENFNAFMISRQAHPHKNGLNLNHDETIPNKYNAINLPELEAITWNDLSNYDSYGTGDVQLNFVCLIDAVSKRNISQLMGGEKLLVIVQLTSFAKVVNPGILLMLNGQFGNSVFKISNNSYHQPISFVPDKPNIIAIEFNFPQIGNGRYTISLAAISNANNIEQQLHWVHDALIVEVANPDVKYKMGTQLVIDHAMIWNILPG